MQLKGRSQRAGDSYLENLPKNRNRELENDIMFYFDLFDILIHILPFDHYIFYFGFFVVLCSVCVLEGRVGMHGGRGRGRDRGRGRGRSRGRDRSRSRGRGRFRLYAELLPYSVHTHLTQQNYMVLQVLKPGVDELLPHVFNS